MGSSFITEPMHIWSLGDGKTLADNITAFEAQIVYVKAGIIERQRLKLAELVMEVYDGKMFDCAHKINKLEAELNEGRSSEPQGNER